MTTEQKVIKAKVGLLELAKQLGFTTEEEDNAALARPPRNKMEAVGVQATAEALEAMVRDGRQEVKDDKSWVPNRQHWPENSEGRGTVAGKAGREARRQQ